VEKGGGVSQELRVERLIGAAPGEVFDAFVDADAQKEWYRDPEHQGGIVETECDARGGGLWISAWGRSEDELYRETCVFQVVDRPRRFFMTCTATAPDGASLETEVEVTFEEEGGGTRMTVVQRGFPTPELRDIIGGGWPVALERLERSIRARTRRLGVEPGE
jgi:uncharacterized protein YndB with AHSA1/START domain